jgi:hypothetical protein
MPIVRILNTWTAASGDPADNVTNTFHMLDEAGLSNPTNMANLVWDFYATDAGLGAITDFFTIGQLTGVCVQKLYNLDDALPRAPILEVDRFVPLTSGDGLPSEVSLCMSYQGAKVSGENQARRRGRIYLGPFKVSANNNGRPSGDLVGALAGQAAELLAASNSSLNERWVVYSPTSDAAVQVVGGWVDNAWDTQRRRGVSPTDRLDWGPVST